jgi:hypothetical protein
LPDRHDFVTVLSTSLPNVTGGWSMGTVFTYKQEGHNAGGRSAMDYPVPFYKNILKANFGTPL